MNSQSSTYTIIVPIYNSRPYIRRGLECLLKQTNRDCDIIVVDDGSTDGGASLIDEIASRSPLIQVIHKKNEGVGKARNDGLQHATGKYVYFMDIDDVLAPDFLECARLVIDKYHEPDMLAFGFNVSVNGVADTVSLSNRFIGNHEELAQCYTAELFNVKYGSGFLWNKLFKREIISRHSIRFGTFRLMEDELFIIDFLKHTNTVCLCSQAFYTYFIDNAGSSRSRYVPDLFEIIHTVFREFVDLQKSIGITDDEFTNILVHRTFMSIMNGVRYNLFHGKNPLTREEKIQELRCLKNSGMWHEILSTDRTLKLEDRLYVSAINRASLAGLRITTIAFSMLRTIKRTIRKCLR